MFGILLSALNVAIGFVLRTVVIKLIVFFSLYFVVHGFIEVLITILPAKSEVYLLFSMLPDYFYYFINLMKVPEGIKIVFSALLTRFIIRRIPVIG
ncbi:DUF2523 family protein [Yersinia enterocolitica]|nr:DUF2523 domain-containing protein [Yersinia enterocolitica]